MACFEISRCISSWTGDATKHMWEPQFTGCHKQNFSFPLSLFLSLEHTHWHTCINTHTFMHAPTPTHQHAHAQCHHKRSAEKWILLSDTFLKPQHDVTKRKRPLSSNWLKSFIFELLGLFSIFNGFGVKLIRKTFLQKMGWKLETQPAL